MQKTRWYSGLLIRTKKKLAIDHQQRIVKWTLDGYEKYIVSRARRKINISGSLIFFIKWLIRTSVENHYAIYDVNERIWNKNQQELAFYNRGRKIKVQSKRVTRKITFF